MAPEQRTLAVNALSAGLAIAGDELDETLVVAGLTILGRQDFEPPGYRDNSGEIGV
jgi:hypothetical protein